MENQKVISFFLKEIKKQAIAINNLDIEYNSLQDINQELNNTISKQNTAIYQLQNEISDLKLELASKDEYADKVEKGYNDLYADNKTIRKENTKYNIAIEKIRTLADDNSNLRYKEAAENILKELDNGTIW